MARVRSYRLSIEDAEDIAQDTMLRLWTMRDELDRYKSVDALAICVARHLAIDCLRARHSVSLDDKIAIVDSNEQPDDTIENIENEAWLQERLQHLPPSEYQILHMRQVEHKSNQDIAAILGIASTSVATTLSRARHRLLDDINRRKR